MAWSSCQWRPNCLVDADCRWLMSVRLVLRVIILFLRVGLPGNCLIPPTHYHIEELGFQPTVYEGIPIQSWMQRDSTACPKGTAHMHRAGDTVEFSAVEMNHPAVSAKASLGWQNQVLLTSRLCHVDRCFPSALLLENLNLRLHCLNLPSPAVGRGATSCKASICTGTIKGMLGLRSTTCTPGFCLVFNIHYLKSTSDFNVDKAELIT